MSDPAQLVSPFAQSYVDTYVPPSEPGAPPVASPVPVQPAPVQSEVAMSDQPTESLEDQNIFELLGVKDGSDDDKEAFLDELQQVIWEDFLENDANLLITQEEQAQLQAIRTKPGLAGLELQEAILVFLEPLIPDLEAVLLEKALELKEDMVKERIMGLKTYYAQQPEALTQIARAEDMMRQDKWLSVAATLNSIQG